MAAGDDPRVAAGFKRRVAASRAFASFERAWPALWPAVAVLGLFAAASLFGLWLAGLPWVLHLLLPLTRVRPGPRPATPVSVRPRTVPRPRGAA